MSARSSRPKPLWKTGWARCFGGAEGRGSGALRGAACLLVAALIAGCVDRGDFGRPRPSIWNDTILPFAGLVAAHTRGEAVSTFIFTDDESELRDRAWRFLMPAHEKTFFQSQVSELSRTRILPRGARLWGDSSYFTVLRRQHVASPAPLFRRIGEDAAADRVLLPEFVALAERVLDADDARLKLLVHVKDLDEDQVMNAVARVVENRCLVAWVRAEAIGRATRYRYALERLAIEAPQSHAAFAEREVLALEADLALFDRLGIAPLLDDRCELENGPEVAKTSAPVTKGVAAAPAATVVEK